MIVRDSLGVSVVALEAALASVFLEAFSRLYVLTAAAKTV